MIKPGRVMFELAGVPEPLAKEALRLAGQKLPVKTKVVKREAELFEELDELRDMTDDELDHTAGGARKELFNLRFQSVTGALENSARLKLAKREIARILTVADTNDEAEQPKQNG